MPTTVNYQDFLEEHSSIALNSNRIPAEVYTHYNVKRGLRNSDGTGVLVGLTEIGDVTGYIVEEHEKIPVEGSLRYRGISINKLVAGFQASGRPGFEEACYLLLFGDLPTKQRLDQFNEILESSRKLPPGFVENMILEAPSRNIMNKLARSILALYSYDDDAEDRAITNVLRQCIELIARFPIMIAYAYQAKMHNYNKKSLYIHNPDPGLSTAENFLRLIRPNKEFTKLEAEILDLGLVLHAEHGGGNNSTFTTHVIMSSDTDVYSAIAAAVGSLKGFKHGGANNKVVAMMEDFKANIKDWNDLDEVERYLEKVINKEAYDRTGLVYGMGHAVYTKSDPRAIILYDKLNELAKEKGVMDEVQLYRNVEKLGPEVFKRVKNNDKIISANVDFYSGFIYKILGINPALYTPIFAMARVAGWTAHILEEIVSGGRIMRPAYKAVCKRRDYVPIEQRQE
jgi:citrate synthase